MSDVSMSILVLSVNMLFSSRVDAARRNKYLINWAYHLLTAASNIHGWTTNDSWTKIPRYCLQNVRIAWKKFKGPNLEPILMFRIWIHDDRHVGHVLLASSSWMGVSFQDQGTSGFQTRSESLLSTGNETTPLILTPKKSRRNTQKT